MFFTKSVRKADYIMLIMLFLVTLLGLYFGVGWPALALSETYFPSGEKIKLPDTPILDETKLEMFVDRSDCLYVLNLRANLLYKIDDAGRITAKAHLCLPADALFKEASLWVENHKVYIKLINDDVVWRFSEDGILEAKIKLRYNRTGNRQFTDLAVDPRGFIYTIETMSGRVEVFDSEGHFTGTFAKVGDRRESLRGLPQSLFMDEEGYLYVATLLSGTDNGEIVKYSYQGLFEQRYSEFPTCFYSRVYVDRLGNVFAVDRTKQAVVKFDRRGRKICRFRVNGLRALAVNRKGQIFLDTGQGGSLVVMLPSEVIRLIDKGNEAFLDNNWGKAEVLYKRALTLDNQMEFIHLALGEVYFHQKNWFKALREFKYIKDNWRFSQTLYELRKYVVFNYWPFLIFGCFVVAWFGYELYHLMRNLSASNYFSYLSVIWSPIKTLQRESAAPNLVKALITIVLFSIVNYLSWYFTNPIFVGERQIFSRQIFGLRLFTAVFLAVLWSWVAFKVGELFGGMAKKVSDMLAGTAVCLTPYIVFQPLLALASHFLSYEEIWAYQWSYYLLAIWVLLLVFIKIVIIEEFQWEKAVGVGLLNLATTILVLCFIGFVLGVNQQLGGFIKDVFNEIRNRLMS